MLFRRVPRLTLPALEISVSSPWAATGTMELPAGPRELVVDVRTPTWGRPGSGVPDAVRDSEA